MAVNHWVTKDGRVILITDMSIAHLENTIRMIDRAIENHQSQLDFYEKLACSVRGEMAMDSAMDALCHLASHDPKPACYGQLVRELRRKRAIKPHSLFDFSNKGMTS